MDVRSEVPEGKEDAGGAVEAEVIVACRFVGCKSRLAVSSRA